MRRWAGAAAVLAAVAAGAGARAEPAYACSCAREPAETLVERADAAFVGTVRARRVEDVPGTSASSGDPALLDFDVERVAKGRLPRRLTVSTAASSASCGLELERGTSVGLVIDRDGREWRGNLCGQLDPDDLVRASAPGAGFVDGEDEVDRGRLLALLGIGGLAAAAVVLAVWRWRRG